MKLKEVLDTEELFHPQVFYDGIWLLGGCCLDQKEKDYLFLNALKIKGENAYQQFLEKYYYKPMGELIGSESVAHTNFPKIISMVDKNTSKRTIRFSLEGFIYQQLYGLINHKESVQRFETMTQNEESEEKWIELLREEIRADRKMWYDVLHNGVKSPYYDTICQLFLNYAQYFNEDILFNTFLENKIRASNKLLVGSKYYINFFKKEIPLEPLLKAFDYDTFCLVAAKSALDTCELVEQNLQAVDNAIICVRLYLESIQKLRQEKSTYDCSMICIDEQTNYKKTIKIDDIMTAYNHLLARHPEHSFVITSGEEVWNLLRERGFSESELASFDLQKKENQTLIANFLNELKENQELAASWEFIPRGKHIEKGTEGSMPGTSTPLLEDEKIRRMIIGKEYLENSNHLYRIQGINKFAGYIGYIYPSGTVIFEKYYENIKTKRVVQSSATYAMDLYNFIELSKLSKPEIIKMIHSDVHAGVHRIYHREDMERWKSEVEREITGTDYTEQVIDYMDELVGQKELKKTGVKGCI